MNHKTWVLLRGLCRESRHWGPFLTEFQAAHPTDRLVPIDLPGVGEFSQVPSPKTVCEMVTFVRQQLFQQSIHPPYNLLGVSLGGMVVLDWTARFSSDIENFVAINTSDRQSPFYKRFRYQVWNRFIAALLTSDKKQRELQILKFISNQPEKYEEVSERWAHYAEDKPVSPAVAFSQLVASARFLAAPWISVRGLFLVSLGDRMVDPSCSFLLAQKFNCKILAHPWAGHDLTLDDPEWVTRSTQEILAL